MTNTGIELEADPRHAELVISELGLNNARPSLVPGSKTEGKTAATAYTPRKRSTQARIEVEDGSDDTQSAKMSLKGESWDNDISNELEIDDDDHDTELDAEGQIIPSHCSSTQ